MIAMASGQPDCRAGIDADAAAVPAAATTGAVSAAWPPDTKHATTTTRKAIVFSAAATSCVLLPHLIPRHCKRKNATITLTAMDWTWPARGANNAPLYSAMTIATAAAVPQVESQSLHPTMKPA